MRKNHPTLQKSPLYNLSHDTSPETRIQEQERERERTREGDIPTDDFTPCNFFPFPTNNYFMFQGNSKEKKRVSKREKVTKRERERERVNCQKLNSFSRKREPLEKRERNG